MNPILLGLWLTSPSAVFVSPTQAEALLAQGALVLDARGLAASAPYLPGAVVAHWMRARKGSFRTGEIASPNKAAAYYSQLGVEAQRPVIVYGSARDGWGEEGRVWWDLSWLGHSSVYIVDGGIAAYARSFETARLPQRPTPGRGFVPQPVLQLRGLPTEDVIVLDARSFEEYWGQTPFLSPRSGHIPGARTFHWKRTLTKDGTLRSREELEKWLAGLGAQPDEPVVVYCTGGVRSAFLVAVLRHLGYTGVNYDGSWWHWSSQPQLPVEQPSQSYSGHRSFEAKSSAYNLRSGG